MGNPTEARGLRALDTALGAGNTEDARQALLDLADDEKAILSEYLGEEELGALYRAARRRRRGPSLGRVVLLPGLMGTNLDSVDASGDADRVWVNLFRIFKGRIRELRLSDEGQPLPPPPTVQTAGIHSGTYLELLFELQAHWDAIPFGYDWRGDLRQSATALSQRIQEWAKGEPVHLVAHSMGGLVARTFIGMFRDQWAAMRDPSGKGRGGRLVMMGTPNRGAFAIVLALSGEEKVVKTLAKIDIKHDVGTLLQILNTFLGSYQTLPSPRVDLGDDHERLFESVAWGSLPVHQGLLQQGRQFQEWLHPVIDPERLLYVAGYGEPTPCRVKIDAPGRFTYELTEDGDGRVPHSLGLLEDVRTYWVKEKHGDLPKNPAVVRAIHQLLLTGETPLLESARARGRAMAVAGGYQEPAAFEIVPADVDSALGKSRGRARGELSLDEKEAARLHAAALADYLGRPKRPAVAEVQAPGSRGAGRKPVLELQVVWADITKAKADVYVAGAYSRVPPKGPLRELDRALSVGLPPGRAAIREQINRGLLTARLGDVDFFPWGKGRVVAVAGMGYAGSFGEGDLRRLARNIAWAVNSLPRARSLAAVLIGSGEGNLPVSVAVRGLLQGLADAVGSGETFTRIRRVSLVEFWLDRALEIQDALRKSLASSAIGEVVKVRVAPAVVRGAGGKVSSEQNAEVLLAAAAKAASSPGSREGRALDALLRTTPALEQLPRLVRQSFRKAELASMLERRSEGGPKLRFGPSRAQEEAPAATRVSFFSMGDQIRTAVITETTTVTERVLSLDQQLVREAVERMTDPDPEKVEGLASLLRGLLIHEDFADMISGRAPLIFDVDRSMAQVHWEMMAGDQRKPLALEVAVARQLRTAYSPPPLLERPPVSLRALVIGDPGDPAAGEDLPGARREASAVAALLRRRGLEVVVLIGAPDADGLGPIPGVAPATRLDVLDALMKGSFELLHYSGHGDFDPERPDRVGWVFKGGLLTPGELQRVARAPRLVFANACLSARTSWKTASGDSPTGRREAGLAPSLADEFFRRGVQDYVGSAWPIDDAGAVLFAETFYGLALADPGSGQPALTLGDAMLEARKALAREERSYGSLWAAYQHYGDPGRRIQATAADAGSAATPTTPSVTPGKREGEASMRRPGRRALTRRRPRQR